MKYKNSIIIGFLIIALGALLFIPASFTLVYGVFLFGLFVLATGVVMLQVSANPLITFLGRTETASARLTLAQGVNSLGLCPFAPLLIVGGFIAASNLYVPYLVIAVVMVLVTLFISQFKFHSVDDPLKKEVPM